MKILNEIVLRYGTKITTYEGLDTAKPHCGEYCVMDNTTSDCRCVFCGKPFDYSYAEESEEAYLDSK